MVSKFPECDLCPTSNCDDEKISQVMEDADFTKSFVNNMLASNIDEISKDCYFMSEVISEKTAPMEIADFAFCIYVQLSQLVEMPMDKRMEIGVLFRQEFDRMAEDISQGREVSKKKGGATAKEATAAKKEVSFQAKALAPPAAAKPKVAPAKSPAPIQAKPVPVPAPVPANVPGKPRASPGPEKPTIAKLPAARPAPVPEPAKDDARKFLADLDLDIAEIDAISSSVEQLIKSEPEMVPAPADVEAIDIDVIAAEAPAPAVPTARKGGGLEPVIGKLAGVRPVATGATKAPAAAYVPAKPREPEQGSKTRPIKLTPEMLAGIVSDKDMARVEKGIKIRRIEAGRLAPKVTAPMQLRDGSSAGAAGRPSGLPDKIERIDRPTEKGKALGEELFTKFQQIKAREELPNTFSLETLGVGAHPEGEEVPEKKASPGGQFITDIFKLSPHEAPAPPKAVARPAVEDLTLDFGEDKVSKEPAGAMKVCPSCNKANPAKNVFCAKCGARF